MRLPGPVLGSKPAPDPGSASPLEMPIAEWIRSAALIALIAIWNERARAQPNGGTDRPGEVAPEAGSGLPQGKAETPVGGVPLDAQQEQEA